MVVIDPDDPDNEYTSDGQGGIKELPSMNFRLRRKDNADGDETDGENGDDPDPFESGGAMLEAAKLVANGEMDEETYWRRLEAAGFPTGDDSLAVKALTKARDGDR